MLTMEKMSEAANRLALILYPRVDDFVSGESNNKDCPSRFIKASRRANEEPEKAKIDGTFGSVLGCLALYFG
nr:zinc ion binding protein [Tanacetum cinerariifolium]